MEKLKKDNKKMSALALARFGQLNKLSNDLSDALQTANVGKSISDLHVLFNPAPRL
jgi:hypothetical protein